MKVSLEDRNIVVTGSSAGIGRAIAREIVDAGGRVMLHGPQHREQALKDVAADLGSQASWVVADLMEPESPEKIISRALDEFGNIHGLVNNAGIYPRSTIDDVSDAQFDQVFTINTKAPLKLTHHAVKAFRKEGIKGSIVNIGSINAWCGGAELLIYSMSKAALMTMTRNLGDTLNLEEIRINQLNVGWTLTEGEIAMQKSLGAPDDWFSNLSPDAAPRGHLMQPQEVARHVVFWLSDASFPVNGSVYEVEQYPVIGRNKIAG